MKIVRLGVTACLIFTCASILESQTLSPQISIGDSRASLDEISAVQNKISISVKDSSLLYVIKEIARQSGVQIVFNQSLVQFKKRIDVRISETDVNRVLATVLAGSGLVATRTPDGKNIVITLQGTNGKEEKNQEKNGAITGWVIDSSTKKGVPDALVALVGSKASVVTKPDGSFTFSDIAAGKHVLSVKLIGYRSQRVDVVVRENQSQSVSISIVPSATSLNEVITTATGKQRRVEVASDIARIDAAAVMERAPVRNLTDLLEAAQVPGVLITRSSGEPGSPSRIRMRGIGSISQNNDPIVIVDGARISAPMSTSEVRSKVKDGFVPSRLDNIDPSSIETVEIIRGPSAATLYGPDAANGVIVITTKKGKSGPTRWDFTYNRDWNAVARNKPVRYVGFGQGLSSIWTMGCTVPEVAAGRCTQDSVAVIDINDALLMDEGQGATRDYRFGLNGGASQIQYAANLSYQDQLDVVRIAPVNQIRFRKLDVDIPSGYRKPKTFKRSGLTTRLSMQPTQQLSFDLSLGVTQYNKKDKIISLTTYNFLDLRDTTSILTTDGGVSREEARHRSTTGNLTVRTIWNPLSRLNVSADVGAQRTNGNEESINSNLACASGICAGTLGSRNAATSEQSTYSARMQLSGDVPLGRFERFVNVKPSWGIDINKLNSTFSIINASGIPYDATDFGSAASLSVRPAKTANATAGWYLNTTIGLLDRVYFDVGMRRDVGSAISKSSGNPKIGTSWVISNERFFPELSWLSTLRLRAAFGRAAVQPDNGDIYGKYVRAESYVNGAIVPAIQFNGIGNPRLMPGRSTELEFGFDAYLLDDRITVTLTSSRKVNDNDLVSRGVGPSIGFFSATRKENIARVMNRGMEFSTTAQVVDNDLMLLSVTAAMSMIDNQVQRLGDRVLPFGPKEARIAEGYPISGLWRLPLLGYADLNGDGVLGQNEIIMGDTVVYYGWMQPRYSGGYNATLAVLNRTLVLNASVSQQGKYTQTSDFRSEYGLQSVKAPLREQAYAFIVSNDGAGVPQTISDVRLQSASVTYHLPKLLVGRVGARQASISLQGKNLALWTRYRGRDPGVNSNPVGESLVDDGKVIPSPRQFNLSINLGF